MLAFDAQTEAVFISATKIRRMRTISFWLLLALALNLVCLLPDAQNGTDDGGRLPDAGCRESSRVRIHRTVLQSATAAFDAWLSEPNCLRRTDAICLTQCPQTQGQLRAVDSASRCSTSKPVAPTG